MIKTWQKRLAQRLAGTLGLAVARKGSAWSLIEPEQLKRFLNYFRVDCVFDVGANIGQYGKRLRAIGFHEQIISFEPNPSAAQALRNVARRDKRWHVEQVALGLEEQDAKFNVMRVPEFSSVLEPDNAHTADFREMNAVVRRIDVHVTTLASRFEELRTRFGFSRPFLKLDTQGYDLTVARGSGDYLREFVGLQSELAFTKLYVGAPGFREALDYYSDFGFHLCSLVPNTAGHFPNLHEMDCIMYNSRFR